MMESCVNDQKMAKKQLKQVLENSWKQNFYCSNELIQVIFDSKSLKLTKNNRNTVVFSINFASRFYVKHDHQSHTSSIVLDFGKKVVLCHHNPTIIEQWTALLQQKIHRLDFYDNFEICRQLGKGLTSTVYLARSKFDDRKLAVKLFRKASLKASKGLQALENQIRILRMLSNENITRFQSSFQTQNSYYIVLQLGKGQNLQKILQILTSKSEIKHIISQVCKVVQYLNLVGVVHRDIKPSNIIYERQSQKIKIIDFGFATFSEEKNPIYSHCGTPGYAAPEAFDISQTKFDSKFDIFSIGILLHVLLFKKMPYCFNSNKSILEQNKQGKFMIDSRASQIQKDIITKMLSHHSKRISIEEIFEHSYFLTQQEKLSNPQSLFINYTQKQRKRQKLVTDINLINFKIQRGIKARSGSLYQKSNVKNQMKRYQSLAKDKFFLTKRI